MRTSEHVGERRREHQALLRFSVHVEIEIGHSSEKLNVFDASTC